MKRSLIGIGVICSLFFGIFYAKMYSSNQLSQGLVTTVNAQTPATLTVCATGEKGKNGCDFIGGDGIQQAINAAPVVPSSNKTKIILKAGTYTRSTVETYSYKPSIGNNQTIQEKAMILINSKNIFLQGEKGTELNGDTVPLANGIAIIGTSHAQLSYLVIKNFKYECATSITPQCAQGNSIFLSDTANAIISNNVISHKAAGIFLDNNATATITNNTLVGNNVLGTDKTVSTGGIIVLDQSKVDLINTIIVYNKGFGVHASFVENSKVQNFGRLAYNISFANVGGNWDTIRAGTWPPATNLSVDPKFVNKEANDFHLAAGSPAIRKGDPTIKNPDGSPSDIGAYGGPGACGLDSTLPGCGNRPSYCASVTIDKQELLPDDMATITMNANQAVNEFTLIGYNPTNTDSNRIPKVVCITSKGANDPQCPANSTYLTFKKTVNDAKKTEIIQVKYSDLQGADQNWSGKVPVNYQFNGYFKKTGETNLSGASTSCVVLVSAHKKMTASCVTQKQGDANCDDTVNDADFTVWKCEFLGGGDCASPASQLSADFDGNKKVDLADFELWRSHTTR